MSQLSPIEELKQSVKTITIEHVPFTVDEVLQIMDKMNNEQRKDILAVYCGFCGSKETECYCEGFDDDDDDY